MRFVEEYAYLVICVIGLFWISELLNLYILETIFAIMCGVIGIYGIVYASLLFLGKVENGKWVKKCEGNGKL